LATAANAATASGILLLLHQADAQVVLRLGGEWILGEVLEELLPSSTARSKAPLFWKFAASGRTGPWPRRKIPEPRQGVARRKSRVGQARANQPTHCNEAQSRAQAHHPQCRWAGARRYPLVAAAVFLASLSHPTRFAHHVRYSPRLIGWTPAADCNALLAGRFARTRQAGRAVASCRPFYGIRRGKVQSTAATCRRKGF